MKKKYDGIIDEILYYSERDENGRWIIPIAVDWDEHLLNEKYSFISKNIQK